MPQPGVLSALRRFTIHGSASVPLPLDVSNSHVYSSVSTLASDKSDGSSAVFSNL